MQTPQNQDQQLSRDEQDTQLQTDIPQPRTPRQRVVFGILITLLIIAIGLTCWALLHTKDKHADPIVKPAPRGSTQVYYSATSNQKNTFISDFFRFNAATGAIQPAGRTDAYMHASVTLADGTLRTFSLTDDYEQGTSGPTTATLSVQDGFGATRRLFSRQTNDSSNNVRRTMWLGTTNAQGTVAYLYEWDGVAKQQRIISVDLQGKQRQLITYNEADGQTGYGAFGGILIPQAVSKDGNTLYLQKHTCIQCDGPPRADIITYDISRKMYDHVFKDPAGDAGYGLWTPLNDRYFSVFASTQPNLGSQSYEEAQQATEWLFLFDKHTGNIQKVAETDADNATLSGLQLSHDQKSFFYYTQKLIKGRAFTDPKALGPVHHEYSYQTHHIRRFDLKGHSSKSIDFKLDTKARIAFLTEVNNTYILATTNTDPNSDYGSGIIGTIRTSSTREPANLKTHYTSTAADALSSLQWLGVRHISK